MAALARCSSWLVLRSVLWWGDSTELLMGRQKVEQKGRVTGETMESPLRLPRGGGSGGRWAEAWASARAIHSGAESVAAKDEQSVS